MSRVLAWFSCGAASACAAKLAVTEYGPECRVIYCDTSANEHPDNTRFLEDVEEWLGSRIERPQSMKYATIDDVFTQTRYMAGVAGARCTTELKKLVRYAVQEPDDTHIFGYTAEESKRARDFDVNNPELHTEWVLIDRGITKAECKDMLLANGIRLPAMYALGYKNNNCIGCVKATSPKYWNAIRRDFPEVFTRRAEQSRSIGCRLTRVKGERIFLDDLQPENREDHGEDTSCGPHCSWTNNP